jgi:hypothetical protein
MDECRTELFARRAESMKVLRDEAMEKMFRISSTGRSKIEQEGSRWADCTSRSPVQKHPKNNGSISPQFFDHFTLAKEGVHTTY